MASNLTGSGMAADLKIQKMRVRAAVDTMPRKQRERLMFAHKSVGDGRIRYSLPYLSGFACHSLATRRT